MNDPCVGLEVIVCLYYQQLVMKNMHLTFWLFRDHFLHICCYNEELYTSGGPS